MTKTARHIWITGHVQGVGFRWHLRQAALAANVCGWVRNCHDGSVEALLCGTPEGVARVLAWAQKGPPHARVAHITTEFSDHTPVRGFTQLEDA